MLRFAAMGVAGAIAAAASAQALMSFGAGQAGGDLRPAQAETAQGAPIQAAVVQPAQDQPAVAGSAAEVSKAADGHFWAEANVDGKAVHMLVDTGATAVALTTEDARRLGFAPANLVYNYQVQTAAGPARAARVRLESVAVAGAQVEGVDAYVIDHGLQTSLLGMSYLGRLSQFEATPNDLILRP